METYKPIVPDWVGEILQKQREGNPLATHGYSRQWDEWKRKYSRKLKYARLNGFITESQFIKNGGKI